MKYLSATLLCLTLQMAGAAYGAGPSALSVNGLVTSSTCSVDTNGSSDATVNLQKAPAANFAAKGMMIEGASFTLNFTGCEDAGDGYVHVLFTPPGGISPEDNRTVLATSGTSKNAGFAFTSENSGTTPLAFDGANPSVAQKWKVDPATGKASTTMKVYYRALDIPVQPGTLSTNLVVSIVYD